MRKVIYEYINTLNLGSAKLTDHLPWEDNGAPLYLHNKKYIYIDSPNTTQDVVIDAFNNTGAVDETTTVNVYFVNDAKILPPDYDDVVEALKGARTADGTEGYISKLCQVKTEYVEDALLTTLEFSFRRLLIN